MQFFEEKESCDIMGVKVPYFELPVQGRGYIAESQIEYTIHAFLAKENNHESPPDCRHYRNVRLREDDFSESLEDIGFFCVDNLPVVLLPEFLEIQSAVSKDVTKVAMVMDLREKSFLESYTKIFEHLNKKGYKLKFYFWMLVMMPCCIVSAKQGEHIRFHCGDQ